MENCSSRYPSILVKLKLWVVEEYVPLLCFTAFYMVGYSPLYQPPLIVYTCLKWKPSIIFWLAYFSWTLHDSRTISAGGRKINSLQKLSVINNSMRRYFPLRLIKLADLTPDKNYLLVAFPHGVVPFGCGINFGTNANNVTELFPGIDFRIASLSCLFRFPLAREFFMAYGCCTVQRENILNLLSKPSKAVLIYPGGNRESHLSHPGNVYTIIKNRKGFIRTALESGSSLVPVFSFGDQNLLDQTKFESPISRVVVKLMYKLTRQEQPIYMGRGIFQPYFGLLPHRRPVTTVVGKPIAVPKTENPSNDLVDDYHEKFYKALHDLFEEYKREYDEAGDEAQLVMVSVGERE